MSEAVSVRIVTGSPRDRVSAGQEASALLAGIVSFNTPATSWDGDVWVIRVTGEPMVVRVSVPPFINGCETVVMNGDDVIPMFVEPDVDALLAEMGDVLQGEDEAALEVVSAVVSETIVASPAKKTRKARAKKA